jgi:REP element-mobilizing transposase RayT
MPILRFSVSLCVLATLACRRQVTVRRRHRRSRRLESIGHREPLRPIQVKFFRPVLVTHSVTLGTALKRFPHRTGHLFQGRFGAVVMDEPHLLAAARYIALNPVVAGLVSRAEDWPWSSTRAQLAGEDDELATVAPLQALIPDFAALLAMPTDAATTTRIERAPTIGRPLGRPEWIAMLERRLGRPLAPAKPRPKAASGRDTAWQAQLL